MVRDFVVHCFYGCCFLLSEVENSSANLFFLEIIRTDYF
ncbi:MAG: hypothetical protein ACI8YQ_005278 [Polaribacter sp.]